MSQPTYDGIVLAGGAAVRLGGISKPELAVGGRRLLDIALDALTAAQQTVVVGSAITTAHPVSWTREDPAGGGPVAAIAAALPMITASTVVVLAADLPFVTPDVVENLVRCCHGIVGVLAVDDSGRDQPLLACYDTDRLREAIPVAPDGASMRSIVRELEWAGQLTRLSLTASPPATWDCDTHADLKAAQEWT